MDQPGAQDEVRRAFAETLTGRAGGGSPAGLGDRAVLETLVRVHRAGEGEDFDGMKPSGTERPVQVLAGDRALDEGTLSR